LHVNTLCVLAFVFHRFDEFFVKLFNVFVQFRMLYFLITINQLFFAVEIDTFSAHFIQLCFVAFKMSSEVTHLKDLETNGTYQISIGCVIISLLSIPINGSKLVTFSSYYYFRVIFRVGLGGIELKGFSISIVLIVVWFY